MFGTVIINMVNGKKLRFRLTTTRTHAAVSIYYFLSQRQAIPDSFVTCLFFISGLDCLSAAHAHTIVCALTVLKDKQELVYVFDLPTSAAFAYNDCLFRYRLGGGFWLQG